MAANDPYRKFQIGKIVKEMIVEPLHNEDGGIEGAIIKFKFGNDEEKFLITAPEIVESAVTQLEKTGFGKYQRIIRYLSDVAETVGSSGFDDREQMLIRSMVEGFKAILPEIFFKERKNG